MSAVTLSSPEDVLIFWFGENFFGSDGLNTRNNVDYIKSRMPLWFGRSCKDFEQTQLNTKNLLFEAKLAHENECETSAWAGPHGTLAKVIVFDQFARCIHRGHATAFKYDSCSKECIEYILEQPNWWLEKHSAIERLFLIVALQHHESLAAQEIGVQLAKTIADGVADPKVKDYFDNLPGFPHEHHEVIKTFGRFPGRNNALGRAHTDEEVDWLNSPECPSWAKSQLPPGTPVVVERKSLPPEQSPLTTTSVFVNLNDGEQGGL